MCTLISQHEPKARKEYDCDAAQFILDAGHFSWLPFAEKRILVKAKQKRYKIQKGERYVKQFVVDGGDKWTFRAIPELHKICLKYDLYPEC